jgi:hypothetical protein
MKSNKFTGSLAGAIRSSAMSVFALVAICLTLNATKAAIAEASGMIDRAENMAKTIAGRDLIFVCRFEIMG